MGLPGVGGNGTPGVFGGRVRPRAGGIFEPSARPVLSAFGVGR